MSLSKSKSQFLYQFFLSFFFICSAIQSSEFVANSTTKKFNDLQHVLIPITESKEGFETNNPALAVAAGACNTQMNFKTPSYFAQVPNDELKIDKYAKRFTISSTETLRAIEFYIFDISRAGFAPEITGNDDFYVGIYSDNAGLPGIELATEIVSAGSYTR